MGFKQLLMTGSAKHNKCNSSKSHALDRHICIGFYTTESDTDMDTIGTETRWEQNRREQFTNQRLK
jgi:hypothetical protein